MTAPRYCFRWNDELSITDSIPSDLDQASVSILRARRVCSDVLVKRLPLEAIDGAAVDFNVLLSASIDNEPRLESGMMVRA
jgi:hypothetical protein